VAGQNCNFTHEKSERQVTELQLHISKKEISLLCRRQACTRGCAITSFALSARRDPHLPKTGLLLRHEACAARLGVGIGLFSKQASEEKNLTRAEIVNTFSVGPAKFVSALHADGAPPVTYETGAVLPFRHSRKGGNPGAFTQEPALDQTPLDSRLRGNNGA
jgi:hypothetical protein